MGAKPKPAAAPKSKQAGKGTPTRMSLADTGLEKAGSAQTRTT